MYEWAREEFPLLALEKELQKFRKWNAWYGRLRKPYDMMKHHLKKINLHTGQ